MTNLPELRQKRRGDFWAQILPYTQYIIQSGVAVLTFFLLIAFAAWYTTFVQNIPAGLPVYWIMLVLLTPLTVYGSVRTYMRPADVVFMLPVETQMKSYFAPAWRGGMIGKSFWLILLTIVAWPFYVRAAMEPKPLLVLLVCILLLKGISNYGSWQEMRMEGQRARLWYRLLRYVAIIGLLGAVLWLPLQLVIIVLAAGIVVYIICLRLPGKVAVPWERLIAAEKNHAAAVMRMLGLVCRCTDRRAESKSSTLAVLYRTTIAVEAGASVSLFAYTYVRADGIVADVEPLCCVWDHFNLAGA